MIRSALCSLSYLVEDMVSVVKWAVGEAIAEIDYRLVQLDYRLQPEHVRQGWAAELADIEAGIDVHEPNAPYLQWGGPKTWPQPEGQIEVRQHFGVDVDRILQNSPYCNRCGYPHPTTQTCLRDQSSAVSPTADRPAGVVADPHSAPPAGHPKRRPTSELLLDGAAAIEMWAEGQAPPPSERHPNSRVLGSTKQWWLRSASDLRDRAAAFEAIENTT